MSYEGGGAITGIGVAAALGGGAVIIAGAGLLLAGKATVLAAKGVMHVGSRLKDAYDEHEKRVAERLERQAQAIGRLEELNETLSETEAEIAGNLKQIAENPEASVAEEYARFRARQLRGRKRALAREQSTAQRLEDELGVAVSRLHAVQEQRPDAGAITRVSEEIELEIERKEETLKAEVRDIEARLVEYRTVRDRLSKESRQQIIGQARGILDSLNRDEQLENRLDELQLTGTLQQCEGFLKQLYEERRRRQEQRQGSQEQTKALGRRILAARLALEDYRCLAGAEKDEIDALLSRADTALDVENLGEGNSQLSSAEKILEKARERNIGEWVNQEKAAMQALGEARALMAALQEDEGMQAILEAEGMQDEMQEIGRSLDTAEIQLSLGRFNAAALLANERAAALRKLRDAVLEAVNRERIKALCGIAREAIQARGFTDIEVVQEENGWRVEGRRDQTPFLVQINEDGEFFFDLGKSGFSSQQACTEEIDALLSELQTRGIILDTDVKTPTLEQERDGSAVSSNERQSKKTRSRDRERSGLRDEE